MNRSIAFFVLFVFCLGVTTDSLAFRGRQGAMQKKVNVQSRMISKRGQRLFKPKLVIKKNNAGPVRAMAVDGAEELLAVAMDDGVIRIWSLAVGRQIKAVPAGGDVAKVRFDESGKYLLYVTGGELCAHSLLEDKDMVRAKLGGEVLDLWMHGSRLYALHPGNLEVYELGSGQKTAYDFDVELLYGKSDGATYFHAVDSKGRVLNFDIIQNEFVKSSEPFGKPDSVAMSEDDRYVAIRDGKKVTIVDVASMKPRQVINLDRSRGIEFIRCHDSSAVFVNYGDELVQVGRSGSNSAVLKDEEGIRTIVLSKDGKFALLANGSGVVQLVNIPTRKVQVRLIMTKTGWMAVNDQGGFDGSPQGVDDVHWQDGGVSVPVGAFSSSHYTPGVLNRGFAVVESRDMARITDGVQMPPSVEAKLKRQRKDSAVVEVSVESQDGQPVRSLSGFRNGKKLAVEGERTDKGENAFVETFDIPISSGRNVIDFVATNGEGLESPVARLVVEQKGKPPVPTVHVITIGVDEYSNADMNLNFAVADSMGVANFWQDARSPLQKSVVSYRINKSATRENIINAIRFLQAVPQSDMAFLFLAGHGLVHEGEWFFIPHEYDIKMGSDALKREGISSGDLQELLESLGPDRVFLGIDACYSGASVDSLSAFSGLKTLRLLSRDVGVCILSSAARDQFAVEIQELGHGAFSYSLLEGLGGMADTTPEDNRITVSEILNYVEQEVPFLSSQFTSYMQYPTSHSRGQNYILLDGMR